MTSKYLIKGDLTNIQKFIFNVLSDQAARSIRGRSFFLKIALEVAMRSIFDKMGIKYDNEIDIAKISTSGGNFILQVENDPTVGVHHKYLLKLKWHFHLQVAKESIIH
jgi:CRISPR-associated protein Csm1